MAPKLPRVKPAASLTSSPGPVKLPKLPTLPTSPIVDAQRKPTWGMWAQLVAVLGLGEPYMVFVLGGCRLLLLGYGVACLMGHAWGHAAAFITHCVIGVLGLLLGVRLQVSSRSFSPRPTPPLCPHPQGSRPARRQLAVRGVCPAQRSRRGGGDHAGVRGCPNNSIQYQAGDALTLTVVAASQMTRKSRREGSGRDSDAWRNMRYTLQVLGGVRDPDPRTPTQWVKEVLGYIPSWVRANPRGASDHALNK